MKANEAPEKIYMPKELLSEEWTRHIEGQDIEYTRTDAFIEKAERYIRSIADGLDRDDDVEAFISGFKNYMKGEEL